MCDKRRGIDFTVFDQPQRFSTIAAVYSACFKDEVFAIHFRKRQNLRLIIEGDHCNHSVGTGILPRHTEGILAACCFENYVHSAIGTALPENFRKVFRLCCENLRIMLPYKLQAPRIFFTDDHLPGRPKQHALQGADSCRACANQQDGVFGLDFRDLGGPIASGKNVAYEQGLFIGDAVWNAVQSLIGIRNTDVFRLSAVDPAAQRPASVQLFTQPCLQKKQFPQKVSTFTVTRSPGRTEETEEPIFSTTPTISWPTVIPGTAFGTEPCLMCRSLVQMLESVTRTMASLLSSKTGFGLF